MIAVGQRKQALTYIDKALALIHEMPKHGLARALFEFQRFAEAVEASDRALSLDPSTWPRRGWRSICDCNHVIGVGAKTISGA
jgi:tetratricopeptide (TPR) repeat protein